jgi:hypothetical protein
MKVLPADVGGEGVRECLLKGREVQLPEGGGAADVILPQPALRLVDTCSSSSGRTVFHELFLRALKTKTMICQDRLGTNNGVKRRREGRVGPGSAPLEVPAMADMPMRSVVKAVRLSSGATPCSYIAWPACECVCNETPFQTS